MKWIANSLIVIGLACLGYFGYTLYIQRQDQAVTVAEAETAIREYSSTVDITDFEEDEINPEIQNFSVEMYEAFAILHVPTLDRSIGVVEGTDPDALSLGVGHVASTVFPGQGEQIVLSGHRDTVFQNFAKLEIGDTFVVEMPYGEYEYEIREIDIVDADDRTVIGPMGEEVLVVTTCYPFEMLASAPERAIFYSYPVD